MLRGLILEELSLAQRIVRAGHEVVPRFRMLTPDGEEIALVQLKDDMADRLERLKVIRAFMLWKAARGFLMTSELVEPDAISTVAVTREDVVVTRKPLSFSFPEWFGREAVEEAIIDLLPPKVVSVSEDELRFIDKAFSAAQVPGIRWVSRPEDV